MDEVREDRQEDRTAGLPARRLAVATVADLLGARSGTALDDVLDPAAARASLSGPDLALARAIATTTFRHLGEIRHALAARLAQGLPADQPKLLAVLATGAAQILYLNTQDHAAVDLAVRLVKGEPQLRHLSGLVNAVLRRVAREKEAIRREGDADPLGLGTPAWLARRWTATYGAQAAASIAAAHLRGAPLDLSVRAEPEAWAERLGAVLLPTGSLRLDEARTPVPQLPGFAEGAWWVQDAAAAIPARLLGVGEGERVLDLCAAPGGKTLQLAAAGWRVTSVDKSAKRLDRLVENLERTGLSAEVVAADALKWEPGRQFDAILLDAPCTATGTCRRHPDVLHRIGPRQIAEMAELQAVLLARAQGWVAPGGTLVYATCSLEPEEGEGQVGAVALEPVPITFGELPAGIVPNGEGWLRTDPGMLAESGGLDGFFVARWRRT